jgi:2-C-methyl-D-erythritol 4-phosphate cytidylyltransferase
VLIHDGARPLVGRKVIEDVISATEEFKAAVPAVPVKDTIKKVGPLEKILETPDRSKLRIIQTPQGFNIELYKKALEAAGDNISNFTDDSSLVESAGFAVYTTKGDYENIKITTPEDLRLAKALLEYEGGM